MNGAWKKVEIVVGLLAIAAGVPVFIAAGFVINFRGPLLISLPLLAAGVFLFGVGLLNIAPEDRSKP